MGPQGGRQTEGPVLASRPMTFGSSGTGRPERSLPSQRHRRSHMAADETFSSTGIEAPTGTVAELAWPAPPSTGAGTVAELAWPAPPSTGAEPGWPATPVAEPAWPAPAVETPEATPVAAPFATLRLSG